MRGYYRAVKRGERWAVELEAKGRGTFAWIIGYHFRDIDWGEEMQRRSIFDSLKDTDDKWLGGTIAIPLSWECE